MHLRVNLLTDPQMAFAGQSMRLRVICCDSPANAFLWLSESIDPQTIDKPACPLVEGRVNLTAFHRVNLLIDPQYAFAGQFIH